MENLCPKSLRLTTLGVSTDCSGHAAQTPHSLRASSPTEDLSFGVCFRVLRVQGCSGYSESLSHHMGRAGSDLNVHPIYPWSLGACSSLPKTSPSLDFSALEQSLALNPQVILSPPSASCRVSSLLALSLAVVNCHPCYSVDFLDRQDWKVRHLSAATAASSRIATFGMSLVHPLLSVFGALSSHSRLSTRILPPRR